MNGTAPARNCWICGVTPPGARNSPEMRPNTQADTAQGTSHQPLRTTLEKNPGAKPHRNNTALARFDTRYAHGIPTKPIRGTSKAARARFKAVLVAKILSAPQLR